MDLHQDHNRTNGDVKRIADVRLAAIEDMQRELHNLRNELAHPVKACREDDRQDCPN